MEEYEWEECECCGDKPVVGKRYSKGVDGGTDLNVCKDCLETDEWDICSNCNKDIIDCKCK